MTSWPLRLYKRAQVSMLARGCARYDRAVEPLKRELITPLQGRVLELGPGAGANMPFFADDVEWIGVEPNPYAREALRRELVKHGVSGDVRDGVAEHLPADDGTIDAVVSTLVLCSVGDVRGAIAEVRRVLRPGGRFVFVEHVAAPRQSGTRRLQRAVRPLWRLLADGCNPDRETWRAIEEGGFARVELRHLRIPVPIVGPHVAGTAVR